MPSTNHDTHMAIIVETNYSKKLGLPGYSSHQYSVTVRTEVHDLTQLEAESSKLYRLLQDAVDQEIQHAGYIGEIPPSDGPSHRKNGGDHWACSPKQKSLILKLMETHELDRQEIENLAHQWHRKPVKTLSTLEASAFIGDLIDVYQGQGGQQKRNGRSVRPTNGVH